MQITVCFSLNSPIYDMGIIDLQAYYKDGRITYVQFFDYERCCINAKDYY